MEAERSRTFSWWHFDEGRRVGLEAELPADQGAVVVRAIDRMAEKIPQMPDEDDHACASARRTDALVVICSSTIAVDPDQDRATVIVHARLDPHARRGGAEVESGLVIHPESIERLACNARMQTVFEDDLGNVLGLGTHES